MNKVIVGDRCGADIYRAYHEPIRWQAAVVIDRFFFDTDSASARPCRCDRQRRTPMPIPRISRFHTPADTDSPLAMFDPSMRKIAGVFLALLAGCSSQTDPPAPTPDDDTAKPAAHARTARTAAIAAGIPVPAEEPSEAVLHDLLLEWYDEADKSGALTLVSASGKKIPLRPKVYSVRKEKCSRPPHSPEGHYSCDLLLSLSLNGDDPSDHGQGISVEWDPKDGKWVGMWGRQAR